MTEIIEIARQNLLSPIVLAFTLGAIATWVKSDLKVPEPLHQALSLYLLLAIGLKGGGEFAAVSLSTTIGPGLATIALGLITPFLAFFFAKWLLRTSRSDSAALAAHYGSVSAVTFIAATQFATMAGAVPEGYLPALVVALEIPGIAIGVALAGKSHGQSAWTSLREAVTGKGVLLLAGGFLIGALSGKKGLEGVSPFFVAGFKGALVLFLLELGMTAASRLRSLSGTGLRVPLFAILVPILHGMLGVLAGHWSGLSVGGAAVLGAMSASASYIAAPAAVRQAIPDANPGLYLTTSLGITFPFNLVLGIPLFVAFSKMLAGN